MCVLDDVLPRLQRRGVLDGQVVERVERWHLVLSASETVSLEVRGDESAEEVVRRFDRALADRLLGRVCDTTEAARARVVL